MAIELKNGNIINISIKQQKLLDYARNNYGPFGIQNDVLPEARYLAKHGVIKLELLEKSPKYFTSKKKNYWVTLEKYYK